MGGQPEKNGCNGKMQIERNLVDLTVVEIQSRRFCIYVIKRNLAFGVGSILFMPQ